MSRLRQEQGPAQSSMPVFLAGVPGLPRYDAARACPALLPGSQLQRSSLSRRTPSWSAWWLLSGPATGPSSHRRVACIACQLMEVLKTGGPDTCVSMQSLHSVPPRTGKSCRLRYRPITDWRLPQSQTPLHFLHASRAI